MIEKMDDFFTARVDGYDEHMKSNIEGTEQLGSYPYIKSSNMK